MVESGVANGGGVVLVYEVVFVAGEDEDRFSYRSGRYSAALVGHAGADFVEGAQAVSVDEAIDWGRGHSDVVIVFYADGCRYSAGRRDPSSARMPRWPPPALAAPARPVAARAAC